MVSVLHCNNDNKNLGGAYIITRRVEEYIRRSGYTFDYLTMDEFVVSGNSDIDVMPGTKTYSAKLRKNRLTGHIKFPLYIYKVIRDNNYKIVHIDIDSAWKALIYAIPAKRSGAKVIVHSHAAGIDGEHKRLKSILHKFCKNILEKHTDKYIGCSQNALDWLCPDKRRNESEVICNGIDTGKFYYDEDLRNKIRKRLDFEDKFIICNVARINQNKNQAFLVDVLKNVLAEIPSAVLLLVGPYTEEYRNNLKDKIHKEKLEDSVIIAGEKNNVNEYLNAADYFVLPSVFEGLGLASIEAQSTGIRCLLSSGSPPESKVTELARIEELALGAKAWADIIVEDAKKTFVRQSVTLNAENTIEGMAEHLSRIYNELIGDR